MVPCTCCLAADQPPLSYSRACLPPTPLHLPRRCATCPRRSSPSRSWCTPSELLHPAGLLAVSYLAMAWLAAWLLACLPLPRPSPLPSLSTPNSQLPPRQERAHAGHHCVLHQGGRARAGALPRRQRARLALTARPSDRRRRRLMLALPPAPPVFPCCSCLSPARPAAAPPCLIHAALLLTRSSHMLSHMSIKRSMVCTTRSAGRSGGANTGSWLASWPC